MNRHKKLKIEGDFNLLNFFWSDYFTEISYFKLKANSRFLILLCLIIFKAISFIKLNLVSFSEKMMEKALVKLVGFFHWYC